MKKPPRRCNRQGKVIFATELDAKIALAHRVWKDKGEKRYYYCPGGHYHLTSQVTLTGLPVHGKMLV